MKDSVRTKHNTHLMAKWPVAAECGKYNTRLETSNITIQFILFIFQTDTSISGPQ